MSTKVEIDSKLAKSISEIAKSGNMSEDKALNEALELGTKELKKQLLFKKLEDRGAIIANKDKYDPDSENFESLQGIIELDYETDAVELVRESRRLH